MCVCRLRVEWGEEICEGTRKYCGMSAGSQNCEASRDSRYQGTALYTRPLLGNSFIRTQQYQRHRYATCQYNNRETVGSVAPVVVRLKVLGTSRN
jgi:hypothetical protein